MKTSNFLKIASAVAILSLGFGCNKKEASDPRIKDESVTEQLDKGIPSNERESESVKSQPSTSIFEKTTSSSVTISRFSTGYDWKRADENTKRDFCDKMATKMSREFNRSFTGDFFYSALETFYDSSDPNILREKVVEIVALTTTVAVKAGN